MGGTDDIGCKLVVVGTAILCSLATKWMIDSRSRDKDDEGESSNKESKENLRSKSCFFDNETMEEGNSNLLETGPLPLMLIGDEMKCIQKSNSIECLTNENKMMNKKKTIEEEPIHINTSKTHLSDSSADTSWISDDSSNNSSLGSCGVMETDRLPKRNSLNDSQTFNTMSMSNVERIKCIGEMNERIRRQSKSLRIFNPKFAITDTDDDDDDEIGGTGKKSIKKNQKNFIRKRIQKFERMKKDKMNELEKQTISIDGDKIDDDKEENNEGNNMNDELTSWSDDENDIDDKVKDEELIKENYKLTIHQQQNENNNNNNNLKENISGDINEISIRNISENEEVLFENKIENENNYQMEKVEELKKEENIPIEEIEETVQSSIFKFNDMPTTAAFIEFEKVKDDGGIDRQLRKIESASTIDENIESENEDRLIVMVAHVQQLPDVNTNGNMMFDSFMSHDTGTTLYSDSSNSDNEDKGQNSLSLLLSTNIEDNTISRCSTQTINSDSLHHPLEENNDSGIQEEPSDNTIIKSLKDKENDKKDEKKVKEIEEELTIESEKSCEKEENEMETITKLAISVPVPLIDGIIEETDENEEFENELDINTDRINSFKEDDNFAEKKTKKMVERPKSSIEFLSKSFNHREEYEFDDSMNIDSDMDNKYETMNSTMNVDGQSIQTRKSILSKSNFQRDDSRRLSRVSINNDVKYHPISPYSELSSSINSFESIDTLNRVDNSNNNSNNQINKNKCLSHSLTRTCLTCSPTNIKRSSTKKTPDRRSTGSQVSISSIPKISFGKNTKKRNSFRNIFRNKKPETFDRDNTIAEDEKKLKKRSFLKKIISFRK
ncbi:hypothetical protein SNEBB_002782 [Seison nebaliae]|nr:hypothetical protein SNEBB_002782 [Seison nebaliae]